MADTKTTALTPFTPVLGDMLYGVDDPAGSPVSGSVLLSDVKTLIGAREVFDNTTDFAAATIDSAVTLVATGGYTAFGDGGGALYKNVSTSEPSHALKVQSADSDWWEIVPDSAGINVHQAGAVGDGATDDRQAILDCIAFLATDNGKILFQNKTYKITDDIVVEDTIIFEGTGHRLSSSIYDSTVISVASGKTGFMVRRGSGTDGDKSVFRNMTILAAGKNTTTTTGTVSAASKTVTLAAAGDFANGDLIMIRGAGEDQTLMNSDYLTGATSSGTPALTLSNSAGVYDGMVLQVAGAGFPADTFVSSRSGVNVTMSANATSTVTAGAITYQNDLCVEIMSGGTTTTLTINEAAFQAVAGAVVKHYDCGIYSQSRLNVENLAIVDFEGAALFIHAGSDVDSVAAVATNANNWFVSGGRYTGNGNGLRLKGNDVNIGVAFGLDIGSNIEYGLVDASFLGNSFFGCHVAGGYGYMTVFLNALSHFSGCYTEGGTINTFAERTMVVGGFMGSTLGNFAGGNSIITTTNAIHQSRTNFYPAWHDYGFTIGDGDAAQNGVMSVDAIGIGGSTINFKRSTTASHGQEGLWGWMVDGSAAKGGMYFSDGEADQGAGQAFFLNGLFIGQDQATLTQTNFRRILGGTAAPVADTWKRGDFIWNAAVSTGGVWGWACVTDGTPGVWIELRGVANQTTGANQAALTNSTGGAGDGTMLAVPAGGSGAAAGGWDTAGNRDLAITAMNKNITDLHLLLDEIRTTLVANGMMKGSA